MKTALFTIICLVAPVTLGADIIAKVLGPNGLKSIMLTTNSTSLVHQDWEALNGGGVYDISGYLDKDSIVLIESAWSISDGIRTDKSSKTVVPTNMIPRKLIVEDTNIELLQAEGEEVNSPSR